MSSLASVQEWLETSANSPVSIWCDDPETHKEKIAGGLGGKTFLSYRVSFKQSGRDVVSVRHRYSEFETLRTELKDRYHPLGVLVPALPPKNQIQSMTNTFVSTSKMIDLPFVKERTFGLTLFCENIVGTPWLKHDATWRSFLLPTSQLSFGQVYGAAEETPVDNIGLGHLSSVLTQLEVPYSYSMSQKMDELREEINHVERHSKFLIEKVRSVQSCQRALWQAQDAMKQGFEAWGDVERLHLKSLSGKAFGEYENVLRPTEQTVSSFNALTQLLAGKAECERHTGDYLGLTLVAILDHQLSFMEAFRELFAHHDATVSEISGLTSKISRMESGSSLRSLFSSSESSTEQIAETKRLLADKQTELNNFYKGLVYFTIPLLARMRAGTLRRLDAIYASCCMSESYNGYKACVEFFRRVGLSAENVTEVAAKMCEVVSLQRVAKLSPEVYEGQGLQSDVQSVADSEAWVYDNNGFLSRETEGMRGLFERALTISRSKGGSSSTGSLAATDGPRPVSTHLFTSTVSASSSFPSPSSPAPLGQNPLSAKRSSAVRGKAVNPLSPSASQSQTATEEESSAVAAVGGEDDEDADEAYDSFDPATPSAVPVRKEEEDFDLPYRPSAFTFESAYATAEELEVDVNTLQIRHNDLSSLVEEESKEDKVASLLDSLLGGGPSPVKPKPAVVKDEPMVPAVVKKEEEAAPVAAEEPVAAQAEEEQDPQPEPQEVAEESEPVEQDVVEC